MATSPRPQQRKLRQFKYLLRQLLPKKSRTLPFTEREALTERFKRLYAKRNLLPLSYKVKQTAFALALSLGIHQAQAQVTFAAPVNNPYNLTVSGFNLYSGDFVDIDGDGDLDFAYGSYGPTLNFQLNTGTATVPNFSAVSSNPYGIVINAGGNTPAPQFADMDGDGDMDLMVTYYDYYGYIGGMEYFQNTGTATAPAFAAPLLNPFGILNSNYGFANVNLHDIDGDGDMDLFTGEMYGYSASGVQYQPNTGTATVPAFGPIQNNAFLPANPFPVGAEKTMMDFADLDGDGDLDMYVNYYDYYGTYQPVLSYFENTGTATAPAFAPLATSLHGIVLPANNSYVDLIFGDLDGDGDEDLLTIDGSNGFVYYENISPTGAAAILNFDSTSITVSEAVGTLNVGLTITNPSATPISVELELLASSTADNGLDFLVVPNTTITIPANSTVQNIAIPITDDAIVEGAEQFAIALTNPTNFATLGNHDTLLVNIVDNDFGTPIIDFDTAAYTISEGGGSVSIPIRITNPSSSATSVDVVFGSSSTADNNDVGLVTPATFTFGANTSAPLTLNIPITDDALTEGTENLVLRLVNVTNGGSAGMTDSTNLTIIDNDSIIGINSLDDATAVMAYPNPFGTAITLAVEVPNGKSVRLVNTLGQILIEQTLTANQTTLSTAALPTGAYWLQVYDPKTGAALWQERLLKQ